jgi:ABC-type multidrug transport system fused ATPase/permease subunit
MSFQGELKDIKLSRRDVFSAIGLTLSLSFKAGKKDLILQAIVKTVGAFTPTITAILAGATVDALISSIATHDFWPVAWYTIAIFGITVVNNILNILSNYVDSVMYVNVRNYIDKAIALKYISIPLSVREEKDFADRFERVREYGWGIRWVTEATINIATSLISFISAFVAMFWVSPILAIVVSLAVIPYAIVNFIQNKKHQLNWREHSVDLRRAWGIEQVLTDTRQSFELQMNGLTGLFVDNMVKWRLKHREKDLANDRKILKPRIALDIADTAINYGATLYVAWQIMLGAIPIGQFVTVRSLLGQLSGSAREFFMYISSIHEELVKANDFTTFMNTPEQTEGTVPIPAGSVPRIEFRHVSFKYPNTDTYALEDVSFTIDPGDSIAIVGENGAGKTTLIKLLVGAYEQTSGEILINDTPIRDIQRASYIDSLGALFQDFSKYDFASLGDNVWYGDTKHPRDDTRVKTSLEHVGLTDLITKFPKGLKQLLSKNYDDSFSAEISGGQWQRLSIARTFYRNPSILVLDEPTSAIDAKAEAKIFQEIMGSRQEKSTIIISHRFSTVRRAQNIIVLDHGKVIEHGPHKELIANNSLYAEMFALQAEGYLN